MNPCHPDHHAQAFPPSNSKHTSLTHSPLLRQRSPWWRRSAKHAAWWHHTPWRTTRTARHATRGTLARHRRAHTLEEVDRKSEDEKKRWMVGGEDQLVWDFRDAVGGAAGVRGRSGRITGKPIGGIPGIPNGGMPVCRVGDGVCKGYVCVARESFLLCFLYCSVRAREECVDHRRHAGSHHVRWHSWHPHRRHPWTTYRPPFTC